MFSNFINTFIILCIRYLYGIEKLCNINIRKQNKIRNYVSFGKHLIRTLKFEHSILLSLIW
jgi:hypothetical protein